MATEIQRLGVVGHPIAHSKSPLLHKAAYEVLGLPWEYEAFDVEMAQFESFLATAATSLRGLSVTMPHKINALEAATELDLVAERTHSVNTLLFGSSENNPTISGFNTDVAGIVNALADAGVISAHHVAVIGGGATASSAVVAAAELGCEHVSVVVRNPAKAFYLEQVGQQSGVNVTVHPFEKVAELSLVDVAISTLPGDVSLSLSELPRTSRATLLDVAYSPWPSARAAEWAQAGGDVVSGLRMLVHQALIQVRIFVNGSPFASLPEESVVLQAMFASVGLEDS